MCLYILFTMVPATVIAMLIGNFISSYHVMRTFNQLHSAQLNDHIGSIGFLIFPNSCYCAKHLFLEMKWHLFLWKCSWADCFGQSSIAVNPPDELLCSCHLLSLKSVWVIEENCRKSKCGWIFLKKHLKINKYQTRRSVPVMFFNSPSFHCFLKINITDHAKPSNNLS